MGYDLTLQKRLAADILKTGQNKIQFDPARLNDIKQAITKLDVRELIAEGAITAKPRTGVSRVRARKNARQRSKGLRKGPGSKEGTASARNPSKHIWINRVRAQRAFLKELKEKGLIGTAAFKELYRKSKGGFFRSVRHIKLYITEHEMVKK